MVHKAAQWQRHGDKIEPRAVVGDNFRAQTYASKSL
jgi:hypothetical protein